MSKPIVKYFPQLTGIRAIAAYMVFIFHFNPFQSGFLFDFCNEFAMGVTIFFVLSGFLITHRYIDNFEFSKNWFFRYVLNRFARIYPMYFILTVLTFIFSRFVIKTVPIFILDITFLRGFSNLYKFTGIPQGWSLTVEECFYLSAPFIFILSKKIKLFLQPVILILIGLMLVFLFKNHYVYGLFENYSFMFLFTFFGRCTEFYIGIKLALLIRRKNNNQEGIGYTIAGGGGVLLCIILLLLIKKGTWYGEDMQLAFGIFTNNFILAFFIGMLFFGLITEKTFLRRLLGSSLFELLGKSSYIFYLIHIGFISDFFISMFPTSKWNYLFIFICLNIVSILLYKYMETPLNRHIREFGKKSMQLSLEKV